MARQRRKMRVSLDIAQWVLLRNQLKVCASDCAVCASDPTRSHQDIAGELIADLTNHIDDFHDLH